MQLHKLAQIVALDPVASVHSFLHSPWQLMLLAQHNQAAVLCHTVL